MNAQEKLLKQAYDLLKQHFEPVAAPQQEKRWMPKIGERYAHIDTGGNWIIGKWKDNIYDSRRHGTGNCYQPHEKERAIWEQVTRRKYEQALWDAADWVESKVYYGVWGDALSRPSYIAISPCDRATINLPAFQTGQSAIDAHTRILGDDAEKYFRGKV